MSAIRVSGHVDEQRQLTAKVPDTVPTGPVTVLIVPAAQDDDGGEAWMEGVAHEWADDLNDSRQDIYTLADGEPVREA